MGRLQSVIRLTTQSDQFAFVLRYADTDVMETTSKTPGEGACGVGCIVGRYCFLDIVCLCFFLEN